MAASITVTLAGRPPFDATPTLEFLAQRAVDGLESASPERYARSLRLPGGHGVVEVAAAPGGVTVTVSVARGSDVDTAIARVRRLFDLDTDPAPIVAHLGADPALAARGPIDPRRRVPGSVDPFETAIRSVVGQQISVARARVVLGGIVARAGERVRGVRSPDPAVTVVFPRPEVLAVIGGTPEDHLPMPRRREATIRAIGASVADGSLALTPDGPWDRPALRAQLLAIPGIGPWTADYVALRALGDRDAFLPTDLGVIKALRALDLEPAHAARWSPYRADALHHLWALPEG